jgi:hypothetical protein
MAKNLVNGQIGTNDYMVLLALVSTNMSFDQGWCRLDVVVKKKEQGRCGRASATVTGSSRAEIGLCDNIQPKRRSVILQHIQCSILRTI